jgi:long-chain acyl-CoA synthetase
VTETGVRTTDSASAPFFPDAHAAADPARAAYVMAGSGKVVSYGELVSASRDIAAVLWSRGLRHRDSVAILMGNDEHIFKVAWACQRIGLRYVAVSTRSTPAEVAYVLADSQAKALFTSAEVLELASRALAPASDVRLRLTTGPPRAGFESLQAAVSSTTTTRTEEREGVDLLYSSGTTGRPKGVIADLPLHPLGTPPGFTQLFHELWGIGPETVYLSPAPLYHAAPLRVSMTVHRYGGTVVVMERFDALAALQLIERYRVTETQMVPTMLIRMLKLPEAVRTAHDLSSLRCLIHAAAPMPVDAKRELIAWLGPIVREFYSATENYLFTELDSEQWLAHPGSVGQAIVGIPHILDEDGNELPLGETGMVWSEGGLRFEYLHDPEKTARARNERGWTTVGDLGHLDEDGYLYLSDRRADLILSGGVNVYPQEAENVLIGHPSVLDVAVFGVPHDELGEVAHAVVQLRDGIEPSGRLEKELLRHLWARLAPYKCPRQVDFASELPRLPTGKLLRRILRERYATQTPPSR